MRTILITGCSSGIGLRCAELLKREGWRVFATARSTEDIKHLENIEVNACYLDYSETASIHETFNLVMEQTGGSLDALFNNGAYGQPGAVEDLTTDVLRQQFEANFFGWHELTNLCLPVMRRQGHGRIVHCSSILGWIPAPWRGAYNASKYALEGLASTMRLELADTDIHVSLIEPGPVKTRFSDNALKKLHENIDMENSAVSSIYKQELARLEKTRSTSVGRFTVAPDAVYKRLDHALNSKRPKAHYPVTVPTYFMNFVRRTLPQSLVDRIILGGT